MSQEGCAADPNQVVTDTFDQARADGIALDQNRALTCLLSAAAAHFSRA